MAKLGAQTCGRWTCVREPPLGAWERNTRPNTVTQLQSPFAVSGTWTHHRRSVGGQEPWPSARASAASIIVQGSTLMLLGGYNGQAFLNDLWFLDVAALTSTVAPQVEWVQHTPPPRVVGGAASPSAAGGESAASLQEQASWPLPRSGHCMGALGPYVIVVGGRHAEGRYNDVCVLDLDSMVWRKVEVQGQPPSGRKTHSAVILGSVMYVFGGHNGDRWLGDMHRLALQPILQQLRVPLSIGARTETLAGALLRRCTAPHLRSDAPECLSNARGGVSSLALPGVLAQLPHATPGQSNTSTAAAVQRLQKELGLLAQYNLDTCPSTLAHISERLEASLATFRGTEMRAGDLHFLDPGYWARPDTAAAASAFSSSQEALGNAGVHHSGAAELGSLGSPVQCQLSARADSRSTADTILLVCGQRFPVHAAVISARCTYFDVLLKSPMCRAAVGQGTSQPREVEVHGVEDVFAFAAMLFFLYTDLLPLGLGDDNVQALFHVSNKFQVPTLLRHCERFLEARITVDNAASMLEMADTVGASSLAAACTAFSTEPWRFPEVAASSGFLALSSDLQVRIVQGHARKRNPTCVLPLVSEKVTLPVVVPGGASVTSRPAQ